MKALKVIGLALLISVAALALLGLTVLLLVPDVVM